MPEDLNIGAIADSIGSELFGAGEGGTPTPAGTEGTGDTPSPSISATPTPSETPAPLPDIPMPKAWKKEKEPLWMKLDREAREYIQTRENDVVAGITQYSTGHKNWSELTTPFQDVLKEYPQVNPVQLLQNLMRNHLQVVKASPEQRRALVAQIAKSYGVDISGGPNTPAAPAQSSPEAARIEQLESWARQMIEAQQKQAYEQSLSVVESFAADPKNKYFSEVSDDIMRLLQTKAAKDLPSAYEMAIWSNPTVRAKLIAEQGTGTPPPTVTPTDVQPTDSGTPARSKPSTIEDTINSVVRKHYAH